MIRAEVGTRYSYCTNRPWETCDRDEHYYKSPCLAGLKLIVATTWAAPSRQALIHNLRRRCYYSKIRSGEERRDTLTLNLWLISGSMCSNMKHCDSVMTAWWQHGDDRCHRKWQPHDKLFISPLLNCSFHNSKSLFASLNHKRDVSETQISGKVWWRLEAVWDHGSCCLHCC